MLAGNQPVTVNVGTGPEQPNGVSICDWLEKVVEYVSGAMYAVASNPVLIDREGLTGTDSPLPKMIVLVSIMGGPLQFWAGPRENRTRSNA